MLTSTSLFCSWSTRWTGKLEIFESLENDDHNVENDFRMPIKRKERERSEDMSQLANQHSKLIFKVQIVKQLYPIKNISLLVHTLLFLYNFTDLLTFVCVGLSSRHTGLRSLAHGFYSHGSLPLDRRQAQSLRLTGLVAPRHVGSSQIRDQTRVS